MKYRSRLWHESCRGVFRASQAPSVAAKRELTAPECQGRWRRVMAAGVAEIDTRETPRQLSSCSNLSHQLYIGNNNKSMQSSWSRPCPSSSLLCRSYGDFKSSTQVCMISTRSLEDESISGPSPTDYSSLLEEREFHKLTDELLSHLQEKIDELGEQRDVDGFDTDHAEGVLTIKLGALGTYVINKQTPNRQIWLSSPVSGPARFDWDARIQRWVYKRTKSELLSLLESELNKLLGGPITLSLESD